MNAVEFVKNEGWDEAQETVKENSKQLRILSTWEVELKRLVESWELLESFFNFDALGFDKCIEIAKKQIKEFENEDIVQFWHRWDDELSCTVERMKQAIRDVESVGGGV